MRIAVVDGGSVTLPTLLHPPPMSVGGRGLSIVRTLTHELGRAGVGQWQHRVRSDLAAGS